MESWYDSSPVRVTLETASGPTPSLRTSMSKSKPPGTLNVTKSADSGVTVMSGTACAVAGGAARRTAATASAATERA